MRLNIAIVAILFLVIFGIYSLGKFEQESRILICESEPGSGDYQVRIEPKMSNNFVDPDELILSGGHVVENFELVPRFSLEDNISMREVFPGPYSYYRLSIFDKIRSEWSSDTTLIFYNFGNNHRVLEHLDNCGVNYFDHCYQWNWLSDNIILARDRRFLGTTMPSVTNLRELGEYNTTTQEIYVESSAVLPTGVLQCRGQ
jgi:hypothetical protein